MADLVSSTSSWESVEYPIIATDVYAYLGYTNYYYSLSVGMFSYDTTALETYLDAYSSTAFDSWLYIYDGVTLAMNMYMQYYYFSPSESFGACIGSYCGGLWLYYDTSSGIYYGSPIDFAYTNPSASAPVVPSSYDATYYTEEGLYWGYASEYSSYYLDLGNAVSWRWMPIATGYAVGDTVDVVTFTSLSSDGSNYVNSGIELTMAGGMSSFTTTSTILIGLATSNLF